MKYYVATRGDHLRTLKEKGFEPQLNKTRHGTVTETAIPAWMYKDLADAAAAISAATGQDVLYATTLKE